MGLRTFFLEILPRPCDMIEGIKKILLVIVNNYIIATANLEEMRPG